MPCGICVLALFVFFFSDSFFFSSLFCYWGNYSKKREKQIIKWAWVLSAQRDKKPEAEDRRPQTGHRKQCREDICVVSMNEACAVVNDNIHIIYDVTNFYLHETIFTSWFCFVCLSVVVWWQRGTLTCGDVVAWLGLYTDRLFSARTELEKYWLVWECVYACVCVCVCVHVDFHM